MTWSGTGPTRLTGRPRRSGRPATGGARSGRSPRRSGGGAGARVDARVVWPALERLSRARLLETPLRRPAGLSGLTRRDLARLGVGIALPAIVSILAPRALAQASDTCAQYGSQQECENPLSRAAGCNSSAGGETSGAASDVYALLRNDAGLKPRPGMSRPRGTWPHTSLLLVPRILWCAPASFKAAPAAIGGGRALGKFLESTLPRRATAAG